MRPLRWGSSVVRDRHPNLIYRVLLTGIQRMEAGEIEADLLRLNDEFHLRTISQWTARKSSSTEQSILSDADVNAHRREYPRLRELQAASERSNLTEGPSAWSALSDLLVTLRRTYSHVARRQQS